MLWVYDDTYDGLLTAVFHAFAYQGDSAPAARGRFDGPSLFETTEIATDPVKADRVTRGMLRLDANLPECIYRAWLSELPDIDDAILAALRLGFRMNSSPLPRRDDPAVWRVLDAADRVGSQAHKWKGLIRLRRVGVDLYASDIEPDYHVLPLLGPHFHERFNDMRLLIRDTRRRQALVSDENGWYITPLPSGELPPLPRENEIPVLWRGYFKAIANPARVNLRLQRQFVPMKYRKNLDEFN